MTDMEYAVPQMQSRADEGQDRLAVVVGGGAGIGEATCETLAAYGWRVAVADIDRDAAAAVAKRCGGDWYGIDIFDATSVDKAAAEIEAKSGAIYGCVCAAAVFQDKKPPEDTTIEAFDRVIHGNVRGPYLVNVAFARRMAAHGAGAIVNFSSWSGSFSTPVHGYCASKAAVNMLTESMAAEWGRSGVRVNAVTPGFVRVKRMIERLRVGGRYTADLNEISALGRVPEPREMAEVVTFLLSDRASAVTGANVAADAGVMAASAWSVFGGVPAARPRAGNSA
jgi:NAD(P)-dependent dehydrogenase (short-subunit alcohol dehydrogenase family)